jgi:hypothetical protein
LLTQGQRRGEPTDATADQQKIIHGAMLAKRIPGKGWGQAPNCMKQASNCACQACFCASGTKLASKLLLANW